MNSSPDFRGAPALLLISAPLTFLCQLCKHLEGMKSVSVGYTAQLGIGPCKRTQVCKTILQQSPPLTFVLNLQDQSGIFRIKAAGFGPRLSEEAGSWRFLIWRSQICQLCQRAFSTRQLSLKPSRHNINQWREAKGTCVCVGGGRGWVTLLLLLSSHCETVSHSGALFPRMTDGPSRKQKFQFRI